LIPTLVKTLHWWYSTVRGLKNSWAGMLEQRAGIERARVRHVPEARQVVMDSLRVSGGQRSHDVALALSVRRVEIAQQAEVEYAQPPVRPQDAVARVRVTGDDPVAPHEAEEAPQGDIANGAVVECRIVGDRLPGCWRRRLASRAAGSREAASEALCRRPLPTAPAPAMAENSLGSQPKANAPGSPAAGTAAEPS
jgi:hypothetical protein